MSKDVINLLKFLTAPNGLEDALKDLLKPSEGTQPKSTPVFDGVQSNFDTLIQAAKSAAATARKAARENNQTVPFDPLEVASDLLKQVQDTLSSGLQNATVAAKAEAETKTRPADEPEIIEVSFAGFPRMAESPAARAFSDIVNAPDLTETILSVAGGQLSPLQQAFNTIYDAIDKIDRVESATAGVQARALYSMLTGFESLLEAAQQRYL